jgi:hypothetical protein
MIDDLVTATYVLAGFTAALVVVTVFYTFYTRKQVRLLKIGHQLAKRDIAVKAQLAWATNPVGFLNETALNEKMKELGLDKIS